MHKHDFIVYSFHQTFTDDAYHNIYICDFYRDAWKDVSNPLDSTIHNGRWVAANDVKSPLFCTGNPFWEPRPLQPTCNQSWPIEVQFYDGSKYENNTLKTCKVNMAESRYSCNTLACLDKVINGFSSEKESLDWLVYLSAGYNARILWYHDFAETLLRRYYKVEYIKQILTIRK